MTMQDRTLTQGETVQWSASFVDANGAAIDFTVATRSAQLRMRLVTSVTVTTTKSTATAADWTWSSQAGGTGYWSFTSTETAALAEGQYEVDVIYSDTATTPTTKHLVGRATITVVIPDVGSI